MPERTPLQSDLPDEWLSRDFIQICLDVSFNTGLFLQQEIACRLKSAVMHEITILDIGHGSGAAIEGAARILPSMVMDLNGAEGKIHCIGVDINSLPELIPAHVFQTGDVSHSLPEERRTTLLADLRIDDAQTLSTVPDHSVDVAYSYMALPYVPDVLSVLHSTYRVLKSGGLAVLQCNAHALTSPSLKRILRNTPGGESFQYISNQPWSAPWGKSTGYIVCLKTESDTFHSFPYRFLSSKPAVSCPKRPFEHHSLLGLYEPTE